jgi:hypothetical protein
MVITPARTQRYRILGRERDALYLPLKGEGRQHLLRFEANAVGWGSDPRWAHVLIIAAASRPPPGSPMDARVNPRIKSGDAHDGMGL